MSDREELLEEYREFQANLEEALELKQANSEDAEVNELLEEIKAGLQRTVASLNETETIELTPGLIKTFENGENDNPIINYTARAPYEVYYDNLTWCSCIITDIISPKTPLDRIRYKVWILGYNIEEEVYSEQLRVWQPLPAEGEDSIRSGVTCHAINPNTGKFHAAKVERLTLDNTVIVTFEAIEKDSINNNNIDTSNSLLSSTKQESESVNLFTVEVPLSHIRVGRFYKKLQKRKPLSEDELLKRRAEILERKKMRLQEKRQLEAFVAEQNANDWQRLVNDMGVINPQKRRRR